MSSYEIQITQRAFSDINECVSFLKNVSIGAAKKLYLEMIEQIKSLSIFPEKYPTISGLKICESMIHKMPVHDGRYNVLYRIESKTVVILDVIDSRRDQILNRL